MRFCLLLLLLLLFLLLSLPLALHVGVQAVQALLHCSVGAADHGRVTGRHVRLHGSQRVHEVRVGIHFLQGSAAGEVSGGGAR